MTKQVQFRRGTTVEHSTFTGALAEITVNTDQKIAVVHDGTTAGGYSLLGATQFQTVKEKTFNGDVLAASSTTIGAALKATGTLANPGTEQNHGLVSLCGDLNFTACGVALSAGNSHTKSLQLLIQNTSNGGLASTDYIVTRDTGNDTSGYGDFGINSSGFTGGGAFGDPGGTYLYASAGTLAIGTEDAYALKLFAYSTSNTTAGITINTDNSVTIAGNLIVNRPTTTSSATNKNYVDAMTVVFGC